MSDMVERVAKGIFRTRYSEPEHEAYWPDRLDELVNGPPFDAEGYRDMARTALNSLRDLDPHVAARSADRLGVAPSDVTRLVGTWQILIDEALK